MTAAMRLATALSLMAALAPYTELLAPKPATPKILPGRTE